MKISTMREAIIAAMAEEMDRDGDVFLLGEDIGRYGGVMQLTAGLWQKFGGNRVLDTPISESGITGVAIGAAMMGLRPVLEIMFSDFLTLAADPITNYAAKMCYAYGGTMEVPLVIRTLFGAGTRSGMHHSQSLEAWFSHVAGLKVVMPATAADAKGLLKAAIRDPNPVIFFEHKLLYGSKSEIPEGDYIVPIGKAHISRSGEDVTIVACGAMVSKALRAAVALEKDGIRAEVIDLRTIKPLDKDTILESVTKTGRLAIVHEACLCGGIGGEIAAIAAKEAFGYLDAPIERIGAPDTPVPFSPSLEDFYIPSEARIVQTVKGMFGDSE
jgi:pyruvate/2-oxoglutarate/acetoin dehydrogenase E1 component